MTWVKYEWQCWFFFQISKSKRRIRLPLCSRCADRLVDIEEFCKMYKESQAKLRKNLKSCLKFPTVNESVDQDELMDDNQNHLQEHLSGGTTTREDDNESMIFASEPMEASAPIREQSITDSISISNDSGDENQDVSHTECNIASISPSHQTPCPTTESMLDKNAECWTKIDKIGLSKRSRNREHLPRDRVGYILYNATTFKTHDCELCTHRFVSPAFLRRHLQTAHLVLECTKGNEFADETAIAAEVVIDSHPDSDSHTASSNDAIDGATKEYLCDLCGYAAQHESALIYHIRRHNNEKPFKCESCDMAFVANSCLLSHIRSRHTHPDFHRYVCEICNRKFATSTNLQSHVAVHSERKPFKCPYCGLEFRYKSNLSTHRRRHEKMQGIPCDYCDKEFVSKRQRQCHIKTEHVY